MKPIGIIVCCVLTIVASASFYGYRKSSDTVSNLKGKIEAQAVSNKAQLDSDAEQIESDKKVIAEFKKQIEGLKNQYGQTSEQLAAANKKITDFERVEQKRLAEEERRNAVPPPLLNADGTYLFPKVVNRAGATLMQNANFLSFAANHLLVFRITDQVSRSFEMDDIHPLILEYLHIDPQAAKDKQKRLAAQGRVEMDNAKIQAAIRAQADEENRRYNAQLSVEQQKAAAAQQAANAAQAQAEADKQKADAILLNAQKPVQKIQIIQQNQQSVGYWKTF